MRMIRIKIARNIVREKITLISRESFEDDFEDIKDLISAKTLFAVDDAITQVIKCVIYTWRYYKGYPCF